MNKWLYKNIYWLYFFVANIRMTWYIFTGQKQKSIKIITEHMDW
jgi:hypothetical protein